MGAPPYLQLESWDLVSGEGYALLNRSTLPLGSCGQPDLFHCVRISFFWCLQFTQISPSLCHLFHLPKKGGESPSCCFKHNTVTMLAYIGYGPLSLFSPAVWLLMCSQIGHVQDASCVPWHLFSREAGKLVSSSYRNCVETLNKGKRAQDTRLWQGPSFCSLWFLKEWLWSSTFTWKRLFKRDSLEIKITTGSWFSPLKALLEVMGQVFNRGSDSALFFCPML